MFILILLGGNTVFLNCRGACKPAALLISCCSLTACGGGSGSGDATSDPLAAGFAAVQPPINGPTSTNPAATSVETLSSNRPVTSPLTGTAAQVSNFGTVVPVVVTGTLDHGTGQTLVDDGTYVLFDNDGVSNDGILSDGATTIFIERIADDASEQHAATYVHIYPVEGTSLFNNEVVTNLGAVGIATPAGDIPVSGSATYTGVADGIFQRPGEQTFLSGADATIRADFGAGKVDLETNGFLHTNGDGDVLAVEILGVDATGMNISGNTFSGGTVSVDGVGFLGPGLTSSSEFANGGFYGDAEGGTPPEVAGAVGGSGFSGQIGVTFIGN